MFHLKMIRNYLFLGFCIVFLSQCSHYSKFFQTEGNYRISGGRYENKSWDTDLNFDRVSWYRELNMYFDVMAVNLNKKSGFYNWLSQSEKNNLGDCKSVGILLFFSSDNELTSDLDFISQLRLQGAEFFEANYLRKNILGHPDIYDLGLADYKMKLVCNKEKLLYYVNFPGFTSQKFRFN